ncbi:DUF4350 domain-containing protein [Microbacteriaceae bacterium VKM Ac-2854]|nr:DUF4350 domain-containing protein [Microbacteriaceae bacterium VKM Ac-2854]
MTGTVTAAVALTPTTRTVARRGAFWVAAALLTAAITAVVVISTGGALTTAQSLAPDSTAPGGARAVVQVLERGGVSVSTPDSLDAARADAAAGRTVLIYDEAGFLSTEQLQSLAEAGDSFVLVDPGQAELDAFAPSVAFAGAPAEEGALDASCAYPPAVRAGSIPSAGTSYRVLDAAAEGCFPTGDDAFALVRTAAGVSVLGDTGVLSNEGISTGGRAALALGMLGERSELSWYLPGENDVLGGGEVSAAELTPPWVTPALLLLLTALIAAAIWRGRRLGPLVTESLPVVVLASETAEGRARLYARNSARLRALDALRIGSTTRLSALLGLPTAAGLDDVARASAAVLGREPAPIFAVLVGDIPQTDADLVRLSDELLRLEKAVAAAIAATGGSGSATSNPAASNPADPNPATPN